MWTIKTGDPLVGETNTATVMPVEDKVLVGVRGYIAAYNLSHGSLAWKAFCTGPDDEMLVDPEQTMALGKRIGADSSLNSREGDQWKIGSGNPSTWNPSQRPGDNKWSMTIMARDAVIPAWPNGSIRKRRMTNGTMTA